MRLIKTLFLLMVLPCLLTAQGPIFEKVQQQKATASTSTNLSLVKTIPSSFMTAAIEAEVSNSVLLELNEQAIQQLQTEKPEFVQLNFPIPGQSEVTLDLVKNKVLADDFILRKSSDEDSYIKYAAGEYYHGVISDDPSTLVSISVFENEIHGMIMTNDGNFVVAKVDGMDKHIVYNDRDLTDAASLDCETEDDGAGYHPSMLEYNGVRAPGDCIRVYIEIDDDIVTNKGGATGATNYITGMFNECITLYANDGITMVISEIKAWDTPAPYSGSSSSAMLNSYQANTGAFNGDLSHLVSYQASGGIAAGFSGICNSNVDNSKCFSSVDASYNIVPQYSFSVMVVTHEMGHLIGSRHTHACVWNGNNTAIDGCAGGTEGSCSVPGSPPGGGTIMSYCHLTTGIDFNQGFGPQPRAVLLNTVNNATCLSTCGGGPTCNDGIQNGQETGVDCGGPDCPACPEPCNDNEITVTINLDNYPEETSWDIRNSGGTVIASGGTYGSQPDGSTVIETTCALDGCYDFTIYDSYGDGICCGYGNGSYTVTDQNSNVLASGGQFGSSETTNFCLGGPPPPTCDDGIQNGQETGVDCGGPDCPACPTGGTLLASYFETGWDGWLDGGSDCYRYAGSRSWEGTYSIRIRDNSGTASAMTSPVLNLSGYSEVTVNFYFYPHSMENGEDFWLRYNDGSGWTTVAAWASGTSFNNGSFYTASVTLNSSQYNFPSNARFRFQCDASANADHIYIDEVTVSASSGTLVDGNGPIVFIEEVFSTRLDEDDNALIIDQPEMQIYPNPARDVLNINSNKVIESIQIVSVSGQLMRTVQGNSDLEEINISDLQAGMYYLLIKSEGELTTEKFIKM